ncbi:hypothetical protein [Hamadaea tsunoensis]|uniref:hypothetical protein n=1 Tax=Hamadaea tsunoensis TaxID=53368 RepID=UPI00040D7F25|nr:hypothetical protein [Hamadaea tsunoensis]
MFLLLGLAVLIAGLSGAAPMDLPGFPAAGGQAGPSGSATRRPAPTSTPDATSRPADGRPSASPTTAPTGTPAPTASAGATTPGKRPPTAPSHPPHPTRSK